MPSVLVVDDEADIRFVVRRMIERMDGETSVVHEASTGNESIELWRVIRPDVVVLDQRMPGLSGLETAAQILAEQPAQLIILFSRRSGTTSRSRPLRRATASLPGCRRPNSTG